MKVSYNRPDVAVIDKEENMWYIVNFAIPVDHYVKEKEEEKIDKYMDLAAEVRRQFRVKTVIVPIVLGTLETFSAKLSESLEKLEIEDNWKLANCCININCSFNWKGFKFLSCGLKLEVNKYPFLL